MTELSLSPLGHTWILDLDGTIVKHNGYKIDGFDTILDGAEAFMRSIPVDDMIVFITSRTGHVGRRRENCRLRTGEECSDLREICRYAQFNWNPRGVHAHKLSGSW